MRRDEALHRRVIRRLDDGAFATIDELCATQRCTREQLEAAHALLAQRDVRVDASADGWRLVEPLELLDKTRVESFVSSRALGRLEAIEVLDEVDSTNAHLFRESPIGIRVCLSELQSAGRARRGRSWISPYGKNVYLSVGLRWSSGLEHAQGLSLAVGVAVAETVSSLGLSGVKLKWPNDVHVDGAKLAGILIETSSIAHQDPVVVIGIGINVHPWAGADAPSIDQPWTNLQTALGRRVGRSQVAGTLLDNVLDCVERFTESGLQSFVERWAQFDALAGLRVSARSAHEDLVGLVEGIDADGALRLNVEGNIIRITSGEVTVRPVPPGENTPPRTSS
ncbi:MAG: biotin--[acetyl-CoA-carboxylase] ligase [Gammaproteobacteria bacterium]|nr:biotin--[acetyl-CoA-carboxylase] ligase [Gammaproteobacteria bacterium]